jgi:hypothetical protein
VLEIHHSLAGSLDNVDEMHLYRPRILPLSWRRADDFRTTCEGAKSSEPPGLSRLRHSETAAALQGRPDDRNLVI